jgi:hypothetical protein
MKHVLWLLLLVFVSVQTLKAQDSTRTQRPVSAADSSATAGDDLLAGLTDSVKTEPLLPHKMIFTQRVFWGPKGLLRVTNIAPLTPEGRTHELKIRRTMLVTHQVMGFVTLAGFVAQGIVGSKLYNAQGDDYRRIKNLHENLATAINISYATTALLSLTAPPKLLSDRRGFSGLKLHKYLAIAHIAGMIATNILSGQINEQKTADGYTQVKSLHRIAAYTTFGTFAASIIAIKF